MPHRFIDALLSADIPVIAEIKARSSEGGDLLAHRSPQDIAARYDRAGAPCLSVVTGRWFGGGPQLLRDVAAATERPILRKDFITRRKHITESVELGASAVLVTAGLLPKATLPSLVSACLGSGLTPFVEVTEQAEVDLVPHPDKCVIAVNNKNIRNRERGGGELDRSLGLLPSLIATGTPCPVSASAIDSPATAARVLDAGFAGLLVGTALMRTTAPEDWVAALREARDSSAGGRTTGEAPHQILGGNP
ncbi:indole-3-glycerol-phosphate synthase [Lipingzhangella sp. LS1_29]|uniref:indole-3-glycerol-phosphate synthase n=1 Tax=Lipingzhangella rawalii TaxID=2055835 RepID=A0ABU2HB06_9ACTN|nr:indole-3-glycerol-phosphate synthase [Lipingzhangella rawalii]MDS1272461.1 indole-3-glycerol-phosphate synthase [Lipingzhangella rawalii]